MSNTQRAFAGGVIVASLAAFLGFQSATVRAKALAEAPRAQDPPRIAVVDVLAVSEKLFLGDRYSPARDARMKQKTEELGLMEGALKDLVSKLQNTPQNSPDYQGLYASYQSKGAEFEDARRKATEEISAFSTEQFGECYKTCVETAAAVARKNGHTHVFASRIGDLKFRSKELPAALQEVLARPLLVVGEGDDLTPAVMKELGLDASDVKKEDAPKAGEKK